MAERPSKRVKQEELSTIDSIKRAITLLTRLDLPPKDFSSMLAALSTAHQAALRDSEKCIERTPIQVAVAGASAKRVLEDLTAAKPLFDKLGYL